MWAVAEEESAGVARAGQEQVRQRHAAVGAVGSRVDRVEHASPLRLPLGGRDLPRQQPGDINAVSVHVGDEIGVVAVVPEDVLMGVDNHVALAA